HRRHAVGLEEGAQVLEEVLVVVHHQDPPPRPVRSRSGTVDVHPSRSVRGLPPPATRPPTTQATTAPSPAAPTPPRVRREPPPSATGADRPFRNGCSAGPRFPGRPPASLRPAVILRS